MSDVFFFFFWLQSSWITGIFIVSILENSYCKVLSNIAVLSIPTFLIREIVFRMWWSGYALRFSKYYRYINDEIFLKCRTILPIKLGCSRENQLAFHRESENTMTVARCCTTCVSRSLKKKEKYSKRTPSPYAETLNTHIVSWKHSLTFFFPTERWICQLI